MNRLALTLVTPDHQPAPQTTTPTQAQRIAAERLAGAATRLGRITAASFMTPEARTQAAELRREVERLCGELRRAGL